MDWTPGWNIFSTPKVLSSHVFSAEETSENFDIYVLDASTQTGWATMADLGQSEFTPLYGYFVNNKTGVEQTLTFNYDTEIAPNEKLFGREFETEGWYSIGVANGTYAKAQGADISDTNNPSKILSLLEGKYDLAIDFTDAIYSTVRNSVALDDPWKAVVPADINNLNDLRETKGYAIYIKESDAKYIGYQNGASTTISKLSVKSSAEDPDATTLSVETDSVSNWMTVFAFDLDAEASIDNVELKTLVVGLQTGVAPIDGVVNDAKLVVEGEEYDDYEWLDPDTTSARMVFNSNSLFIEAGERVTVEVQVEFKQVDGITYAEGETITASANSSGWVAESVNGVALSGSVVGDTHTLRSSGVVVEAGDTEAVTQGDNDQTGIFTIEFDITAFEKDIYIQQFASTTADSGVEFLIEGPADPATVAATLTSTADEDSPSVFSVREGETETFSLTVSVNPSVSGQYRVTMSEVNYTGNPGGVTDIDTHLPAPASDYRTDYESINAA